MSDLSVQAVRHNRETAKRLKQVLIHDLLFLPISTIESGVS